MRIPPILPPTIFETFPRAFKASQIVQKSSLIPQLPRQTLPSSRFAMTSATGTDFSSYGIDNASFPTAAGVSLSDSQKLLTGSVLDLFAGNPSKRKLTLWTDDAVFADPLTIATGRKQYEAQWYGLKAAFSEITREHVEVTKGGNPIELGLTTKYTVKGIHSTQTIQSLVKIHTTEDGDKITKVEDRWDGNIPEGSFAKAMRNLNSVVVPAAVR